MSSDSEDDCYGNIAQKLQSIKSKYNEDKIETSNFLVDSNKTNSTSEKVDNTVKVADTADTSVQKDSEVINNNSDDEEITLDTIIAQNRQKRLTRKCKRKADISVDNILPTQRRKTSTRSKNANKNLSIVPDSDSSNQSAVADTPKRLKRGRRSAKTARTTDTTIPPTNTAHTTVNATNVTLNATNVTVNTTTPSTAHTNTSSRARNTDVNDPDYDLDSNGDFSRIYDAICNMSRSRRGRERQRRSSRRERQMWVPDYLPIFNGTSHSRQIQSDLPVYSVGNTAEYPDESCNQPLFTNPQNTDDIVIVGDNEPENDSIDENEELSVKVYWQNREYIRFPIRRFQKLTQMFEFFAKREQVSQDKLFFTYNEKVLKIDDTPDSITYSIVKFIDGGIINQSVSKIIRSDQKCSVVKNGIKLKFQCQNVKKPFETTVQLDDKMAVAMMMCAEHWEKPLEKLKFHFDGDLITGKTTPRDLELEGGECIDVKISS